MAGFFLPIQIMNIEPNQISNIQPPFESASSCIITTLLADGWREYSNQKQYARSFYKQFDTPTCCHGNEDKPGVQIEIAVGDGYCGGVMMELELCAGLKDGTWLIIHNYLLPQTVEEVTALIPRMLAVWESANIEDMSFGRRGKDPEPSGQMTLAL
jgi:hypothetical protein